MNEVLIMQNSIKDFLKDEEMVQLLKEKILIERFENDTRYIEEVDAIVEHFKFDILNDIH